MKNSMRVTLLVALCLVHLTGVAATGAVRRLAVLPFRIHSEGDSSYLREGLVDIMESRVRAEGSIELVDKRRVQEALGDLDASRASRQDLGSVLEKAGADFLLYGSVTQLGQALSIDARLLDAKAEVPATFAAWSPSVDALLPQIDQVMSEVQTRILGDGVGGDATAPRAPTGPARAPLANGFEPSFTLDVAGRLWGLGVGDVTGDGANEVVVIDSTDIYVYSLKDASLQLLVVKRGKAYEEFVHLDLADLDGDGAAEIFVTSVRDGPRSMALGWKSGALEVSDSDLPYFLRVFNSPAGQPRLIAQEASGGDGSFDGVRREIRYRDGRFVAGEPLDGILPLYQYEVVDLDGDGAEETLLLDGENRLVVRWSDESMRRQGGMPYGGSCVQYEMEPDVTNPDDDYAKYIEIPVRMVPYRVGSDGGARVIVVRNNSARNWNPLSKITQYDNANLYSVGWTGQRLVREWQQEELEGCLTDLQVGDVDNDGRVELVTLSVTYGSGTFSGAKSLLQVFEAASL